LRLTGSRTGSALRIGIIHARWNTKIIDALLEGTKRKLKEAGVKDENVVVQSVPGSYELPYAVKQCVSTLFLFILTIY
jgi:6,7-dimethyl-8-ribityllumazine synthase